MFWKGIGVGLLLAAIVGKVTLYAGGVDWLKFTVLFLPGLAGGYVGSIIGKTRPVLLGLLIGVLSWVGILLLHNFTYDNNCDDLGCSIGLGILVLGGLLNIVGGLISGVIVYLLSREKSSKKK